MPRVVGQTTIHAWSVRRAGHPLALPPPLPRAAERQDKRTAQWSAIENVRALGHQNPSTAERKTPGEEVSSVPVESRAARTPRLPSSGAPAPVSSSPSCQRCPPWGCWRPSSSAFRNHERRRHNHRPPPLRLSRGVHQKWRTLQGRRTATHLCGRLWRRTRRGGGCADVHANAYMSASGVWCVRPCDLCLS